MTKLQSYWYRFTRRVGSASVWCLVLMGFALAACGAGATSPVGPLGTAIDLRSSVPATVTQRFPTDAGTQTYSTTQQVCNTPGRIQFNWHVAPEDTTRYIVSFDTAVVQSAPNYEFVVLPLAPAGMFDASTGVNSQTYEVAVECRGHLLGREEKSTFQMVIRADGTSEIH